IVAVRNTDFKFFRTMPHLKRFGMRILEEADNVIHINPAYQIRLENTMMDKSLQPILHKKSMCIPNGINDFWHQDRGENKAVHGDCVNLLFVGAFVPLKNVPLRNRAALILSQQHKVTITLVGGGGRIGRGGADKETLNAIDDGKRNGLDIRLIDKV